MEEYRIYSSDLNYQLKNKPRIANNVEDADRIVLQAQVTSTEPSWTNIMFRH